MEKAKILEIIKANINLGGLVADALDEILEPALQAIVDKSENKFDDMAMQMVYPLLEKELKEQVEKLINKYLNPSA